MAPAQYMAYRHPEVLRRFARDQKATPERAERVWMQFLRYLWRSAVGRGEGERPTLAVDEMWHTFLLYNRDYNDFCMRAFGTLIYHVPEPIE